MGQAALPLHMRLNSHRLYAYFCSPPINMNLRLKIIVLALLLPMLAQAQPPLKGQTIDKIIAKVDNYIILKSDLDVAVVQAKQQQQNAMLPKDLECRLFETLVINKLMLAKAEYDSVTVEPKQVDEELDRRMQYMIQQVGSKEKIEQLYKKSIDQLKSELRKQMREQLLGQKMEREITKDLKVTPAEVRRFYEDIPKDSLPYFSAEVEIGQIVVTPKLGRAKKQEARERLLKLKERVQKGEDFEMLAKVYSEDIGSAQQGGDLGFAGPGMMVKEFETAALRLKPGEMSEPVESQFGFHLVKLEERRGNEYRARHILIKPVADYEGKREAMARLDSIRLAIVRDSIGFAKAAKTYSEDQSTKEFGGMFVEQGSKSSRIATENLQPDVFFTLDTMDVGQISSVLPYKLPDGKEAFRILYYKAKYPPHTANLKDDYQKIYNACLAHKKNSILTRWFEKTRNEVFISIGDEYKPCNTLQLNN